MANERRDAQAGNQGQTGGPGGERRGPGGFGGGRGPGGPGGFGGRGPGGPGGFGGRGGPGGDRGGRGRRGEDRGPVGFEGAALEFARAIDKPLLASDFEAQLPPLENLVGAARRGGGKTRSLDELPHDPRGKLLTALLRVMRQRPVEDEEKEAKRRQVYATVAEVWRSLGDERRAELAQTEAGDAQPAAWLLAHTGEWDKVAALAERERRWNDAAKLYEEHDRIEDAARLYQKGGDAARALGMLAKLGNREAVIEAAKQIDPRRQEEVLLGAGLGDVLMDLLVGQDRWEDVGRLYERAEQWADAARAYEKVGRTHKAIRAFDQAGETAEAERLIEAEAKERLDADDAGGAAKVWARFGRPAKAAELATDALSKFRWLREAGQTEAAQELAKGELQAAQEAGKEPLEQAPWMARSGDTASALRIYDEHRKPEDAAALFEELQDWELAARCHEMAGKTRKAADLFERAGNTEAAARLRALEPEKKPRAAGPKAGGKPGGGKPGGARRNGGGRPGGGGRRPAPKKPQG